MCIVMVVVMIESVGMFLALGEMTGRKIDQAALDPRPARRRRRHHAGRHLQHLPVHVVLAECRPRRRHRHPLALGHGGRRRHHAGARLPAEDGGAGRGGAAGRARRRRPRDVRHGRGHRRAHPHQRRLQDQPLQPVRGRDLGRLRHDPAGGAELLPLHAGRASSAAGIRHPARRHRRPSSSMRSSTALGSAEQRATEAAMVAAASEHV